MSEKKLILVDAELIDDPEIKKAGEEALTEYSTGLIKKETRRQRIKAELDQLGLTERQLKAARATCDSDKPTIEDIKAAAEELGFMKKADTITNDDITGLINKASSSKPKKEEKDQTEYVDDFSF